VSRLRGGASRRYARFVRPPAALVLHVAAVSTLLAQSPDRELLRVREEGTVRVAGEPNEVYVLLSPSGQQRLTRSWDIQVLSPASGAAEPGATFTKTHRRAPVQQIWTVAEARPPERIVYTIFVAGLETWVFEIDLRSNGPGATTIDVRHTITSLSPEANRDVQQFADTFESYLEGWRESIERNLSP
jgi:hypothetical protein